MQNVITIFHNRVLGVVSVNENGKRLRCAIVMHRSCKGRTGHCDLQSWKYNSRDFWEESQKFCFNGFGMFCVKKVNRP